MTQTALSVPIVYRFRQMPPVEQALLAFGGLDGVLLLHSATHTDVSSVPSNTAKQSSKNQRPLGRYSFLMADPFDSIVISDAENKTACQDALRKMRATLQTFKMQTVDGLPPMQGGLAGLFSYELNQAFETVPLSRHDSFPVPALMLGAYDCVIAWDHYQQTCYIISQGFPETEPAKRSARAHSRIEFFLNRLKQPPAEPSVSSNFQPEEIEDTSPRFTVDGPDGLTSNFSKTLYVDAVQKSVDYIYAGDVFQINLAQQLRMPANCRSDELFRRLRQCNPAPFSAYYDFCVDGFSPTQIISASPERLISVRDRIVETRPIKGTRRRTGQPIVDIHARNELLASGKDIAENTMIVDLMRNDLSRVCEDDSVIVPQLCELEEYASVLHLVSSVEGRLRPECDLVDLITAIFPGGSITGAPKVRAMEIIAELEPDTRGPYCGSLGYLGFDGKADLNILIRTVTAQKGWWQIPVGGGIVSQSVPESEYEETWTKAAGMLRATSPPATKASDTAKLDPLASDAFAANEMKVKFATKASVFNANAVNHEALNTGPTSAGEGEAKVETKVEIAAEAKAAANDTAQILIIDNYDSFVHNLARYFRRLGVATVIKRNDQITIEQIENMAPRAIVISPGPCSPDEAGISLAVVKAFADSIPILGVCLGHQAIVQAFGGRVVRSGGPMHGRSSQCTHDGTKIFQGMPEPFTVGRYHSLIAEKLTLPDGIVVAARASDGTIMAVEHETFSVFGLQFHPESILTEQGSRLLANFLHIAGIAFEDISNRRNCHPNNSQPNNCDSNNRYSNNSLAGIPAVKTQLEPK